MTLYNYAQIFQNISYICMLAVLCWSLSKMWKQLNGFSRTLDLLILENKNKRMEHISRRLDLAPKKVYYYLRDNAIEDYELYTQAVRNVAHHNDNLNIRIQIETPKIFYIVTDIDSLLISIGIEYEKLRREAQDDKA